MLLGFGSVALLIAVVLDYLFSLSFNQAVCGGRLATVALAAPVALSFSCDGNKYSCTIAVG
jgi:hypothetical protein